MFKVLEGSEYSAVEKPEGSAFSHARRKVDPAAFAELNSIIPGGPYPPTSVP